MFTTVLGFIGLALLLGVVAFAIWRGGPAERNGAIMVAVAWIGAGVAQVFIPHIALIYVLLVADTLLALGFLLLAIRYSSRWLAVAMLLQGASLGFQAVKLMDLVDLKLRGTFLIAVNLLSLGILGALLGGTLSTMRRRRQEAAGL